mmetsp:Transcript_64559/g.163540  ORF Transcript_64559/g.163540 Transcript_64559/m.163540 type:complete len:263 (+) Transcript_64559:40-828(+)
MGSDPASVPRPPFCRSKLLCLLTRRLNKPQETNNTAATGILRDQSAFAATEATMMSLTVIGPAGTALTSTNCTSSANRCFKVSEVLNFSWSNVAWLTLRGLIAPLTMMLEPFLGIKTISSADKLSPTSSMIAVLIPCTNNFFNRFLLWSLEKFTLFISTARPKEPCLKCSLHHCCSVSFPRLTAVWCFLGLSVEMPWLSQVWLSCCSTSNSADPFAILTTEDNRCLLAILNCNNEKSDWPCRALTPSSGASSSARVAQRARA